MGQHTALARRFGLYLWVYLTSPRTRGSDAPAFLVGRVDSHIMAWTRKGLRVSHPKSGLRSRKAAMLLIALEWGKGPGEYSWPLVVTDSGKSSEF